MSALQLKTPDWADNLVLPFDPCGKCPAMPPVAVIRDELLFFFARHLGLRSLEHARWVLQRRLPSFLSSHSVLRHRHVLVKDILAALGRPGEEDLHQACELRIEQLCLAPVTRPGLGTCANSPLDCRSPILKSHRMRLAAARKSLQGNYRVRPHKEWLRWHRRVVCVEGCETLLRTGDDYSFHRLIMGTARSKKGARHGWLLPTEDPGGLVRLCKWMVSKELKWPKNLIPIIKVSARRNWAAVEEFAGLPIPVKGVWLEPLQWDVKIMTGLAGVNWLIVGGGESQDAPAFRVETALMLAQWCRQTNKAFFVTRAGCNPTFRGKPLRLRSKTGADWARWPRELLVRTFPLILRHEEFPEVFVLWPDGESPWTGRVRPHTRPSLPKIGAV